MKKIVGIILGILLIGSIANAQTFDFGVKGGYLYSSVTADDFESIKSVKEKGKSGYLLGVFARVGGDKWYFQPELQYRARTADFELENVGMTEVDCKTLDIPLEVGVKVLKLPMVKIGIHAGPVASIKLSDDTSITDAAQGVEGNIKNAIGDYKSLIWAGQIGVSVDVSRFVIDLSYEKGFTDIAEHVVGKNDLFMATLGVKLF